MIKNIEHVVEATLGIRIIPIESLQKLCDMEGFISKDFTAINDDDLFSMVAPLICGKFDVSPEVIEKRLRKENIMSFMGK